METRSRRSGYVPQEIEPKWQKVWAERGVMKASDNVWHVIAGQRAPAIAAALNLS